MGDTETYGLQNSSVMRKRPDGQRVGLAADWAALNPILERGEIGVAEDTNVLKVGNGTTRWSSLTGISGGGGGAVSSVDGQTGAVDLSGSYAPRWTATTKTGAYIAVRGELVLADATPAGFTVTLPATPAAGDAVAVKKIDAGTNVVTVAATGKTIDGDPNATIVSEDAGGVFSYDGANWQVTGVFQTASSSSVTSVAGRTGAVVLSAADLSDLSALLAAKASTTHAATHAAAGSDPVTLTQAQVTGLTAALGALAPSISPVSKISAYTAAAAEFVQADATSAGFTVTLPTSPAAGAVVIVRKIDATSNVVTVAPAAGGTIDGDANASITSRWGGGTFMHVGSNAWLMTSVTGSRA